MSNSLPTEFERQSNLTFRLNDIQTQSQGRVQITLSETGQQNLIRAMGDITKEESEPQVPRETHSSAHHGLIQQRPGWRC